MLAARRLTSHSNGAGQCLVEIVQVEHEVALRRREDPRVRRDGNRRKPRRGAPLDGVPARSAAMMAAPPRKNANGEAAMRPCRTGTSSAIRPSFNASITRTGSCRASAGGSSRWSRRRTWPRALRPASRRSPAVQESERRGTSIGTSGRDASSLENRSAARWPRGARYPWRRRWPRCQAPSGDAAPLRPRRRAGSVGACPRLTRCSCSRWPRSRCSSCPARPCCSSSRGRWIRAARRASCWWPASTAAPSSTWWRPRSASPRSWRRRRRRSTRALRRRRVPALPRSAHAAPPAGRGERRAGAGAAPADLRAGDGGERAEPEDGALHRRVPAAVRRSRRRLGAVQCWRSAACSSPSA